jgi:hypothetical protein
MVQPGEIAPAQEVMMKPTLLFGLAVLSAGALGGGASAQPEARLAPMVSGHVQPGFGHYGDVGRPFVFGRSDSQRRGRSIRPGWIGGWGDGVYEDPESLRDAGFFAGSADAYSDGHRVHYDYDRGYPYDWYREGSARTSLPIAYRRSGGQSQVRCGVEAGGVRVCRGGR